MTLHRLRNVKGFFSDYYLGAALALGTGRGRRKKHSDRESDFAFNRFLRIRERANGRADDAASCREKFIRPFLRDILGFHLGAGEDRIHGLFLSAEAEERGEKPLLVAYCGSWDEDFDAGRGAANPAQQIEKAIARTSLRYGLLLSGERIRLIRATGEGPRGSYLEADIEGLAEDYDSLSFPALLRFFSSATFAPDSEGKTAIDEIERESRLQAQKVSDDLKRAVFASAESLVSGLIEDAAASGRIESPLDLKEADLLRYRDAALTCLYRILFILYAEARDPRLDSHRLYRDGYSAQGLLDEILENAVSSRPANRSGHWQRLRALFRIYDKGLPRISEWENIPPRGSDFFSSETDKGLILDEARLSDRIVARLMLDLATSAPRPGVGRERVSFRELDIENLGAVYEGLLEYEPRIAGETIFEVQVQGRLLALTPADLVRLCERKDLALRGDFALVADTTCAAFHPEFSVRDDEEAEEEDLPEEAEPDSGKTDEEDDPDEEDEMPLKKGSAARILRRLEPGMFHFVPGPSRKGSGSFYTPRPLVQDLVRHALGPLVVDKTPAEIERLRVLDPACGSAHFLVEAMRFLGQALHRAYVEEGKGHPPRDFRSTTSQGWDADWRAPDEEARFSNSEARAWCKRRIAERCLFGVDLNPTAVDLARVALWIESAAGDRPLTYFEHHVRIGNSLLGTWLDRLDKSPLPGLGGRGDGRFRKAKTTEVSGGRAPLFEPTGIRYQLGIFRNLVRKAVMEAADIRRLIDAADAESLRREGVDPDSVDEQKYKDSLRRKAEEILGAVKLLFDLRSASAFVPEIWAEWDFLCNLIQTPEELRLHVESREWWAEFEKITARERFFHWELEFPEVFLDESRPGFDAVLGNPPWDKILPNRHEFYAKYDVMIRAFKGGELDQRISELNKTHPHLAAEYGLYRDRINKLASILKSGGDYRFNEWIINGKTTGGHQDAFKYFVEQGWKLAAQNGRIGFVVPSAIYNNEGCTGLRHLLLDETRVERFYGFENRRKIFPIDSRYKFVSLVFRKEKAEPETVAFEAAFMRHDLEELDETALWHEPGREDKSGFPGPIPWAVSVRRDELERLSPGTLAFLEYRSPSDREILLKMYEGRPLLGDQGPGTWNARFYTEFNMTTDRDLWTDPKTRKLWNPRQILGNVPGTTAHSPFYEPPAWPEIRGRMADAGFWPLYEGKHIEQFLIDIKPIERWVSLEAAKKKNGRFPDKKPKLVFRDIARNTDERTCIAAVLPEKACSGNTLATIECKNISPDEIATLLNSLPVDFSIRLRIAATHLNFTYMARLAILEHSKISRIPAVKSLSADEFSVDHISRIRDKWEEIWASNQHIGNCYNINPDDFNHLLATFPVFARKRPEFFGYLINKVSEWNTEYRGGEQIKSYSSSERSNNLIAAEAHDDYGAEKQAGHEGKKRN